MAKAKETLPANQIFQMMADGLVLDGNDMLITILVSGQSFEGWTYTLGVPSSWSFGGSTGSTGVYYFEGNAAVSGSPSGWQTTLLATGNVDISGKPQIQTLLLDTLIVADGNVTISGGASGGYDGLIAAGNAVELSGNATLDGVIVARGGMVEDAVSGSPRLTYNCESYPLLPGVLTTLAVGP